MQFSITDKDATVWWESEKNCLVRKHSGTYTGKTVDEFMGMNPKDVISYIEGEPFI